MGGKSKTTASSVSGSAQKWAQPYATAGASAVQNVFNQNQPGLDRLTQMVQGDIVPSLSGKYKAGLPGVGQAQGYYGDVLSGKYLEGNPHLDQIISRMRSNVADGVNSQFSLAGRYGSGMHTDVLADSLADAEGGLRYQNYATEMDRMGQAAQGSLNANTADISQLLAALGVGAELPYVGSSNLGNSLGALFNGGTSTQTQKGPGLLGSLLGGAAQIGSAAIMAGGKAASARELKTDIEEVGLWDGKDALRRYRFRYRGDPSRTVYEGVMADEVKALRPHAYVPNFVGDKAGVNYAAL